VTQSTICNHQGPSVQSIVHRIRSKWYLSQRMQRAETDKNANDQSGIPKERFPFGGLSSKNLFLSNNVRSIGQILCEY